MQVIIAELNGTSSITENEARDIQKKNPNIQQILLINRIKDFEAIIDSPVMPTVVISNFPPNSSYPGSEKPKRSREYETYTQRYYEADSYSKSTLLFSKVNAQALVKSVHIITGAPEKMVNLATLQHILHNKILTYQSRSEWIDETKNYHIFHLKYLEGILLKLKA